MNSRFSLENITKILFQSYGMRIKEKNMKEEGLKIPFLATCSNKK